MGGFAETPPLTNFRIKAESGMLSSVLLDATSEWHNSEEGCQVCVRREQHDRLTSSRRLNTAQSSQVGVFERYAHTVCLGFDRRRISCLRPHGRKIQVAESPGALLR